MDTINGGRWHTAEAFSGANTGNGFVSFYDSIFNEESLSGLYIIKGGPGTGKSTFMRRVGERAAKYGFAYEHYLCGSDDKSLDGIIVTGNGGKRIGILDGTPPHPKEFRSPGAAGDILNFGVFWDSIGLRKRRKEIEQINREKSACFDTAYRYLGAANKIDRHISLLIKDAYLSDKAYAAASRLVSSVGESGTVSYRQLTGFTMNGTVNLSPDSEDVREYVVSGNEDAARLFLGDAVKLILSKGISAQISRSPLNLKNIEGIYFPESNVWLHISHGDGIEAEKIINTGRFIDKDILSNCRQKIRFGKKCRQSLMDGAMESLSSAKQYHFELEEIYKENMNFDALNHQSEIWYSEILSRLD